MTFNFDNDNKTRDFDMDGEFMVMILMNFNDSDIVLMVDLVKFMMFVCRSFMMAMWEDSGGDFDYGW